MERPKHYGKWGQRGVLTQEQQRKGCCRWCGDEIPKDSRRTSYCSKKCADECWLRISWNTMRAHIIERDGVCKLCDGASYKRGVSFTSREWYEEFRAYAEYTRVEPEWHVDHILPCIEGGTDDPANLRLLCGRCHKRVTKEWHGLRAAARRPQRALELA